MHHPHSLTTLRSAFPLLTASPWLYHCPLQEDVDPGEVDTSNVGPSSVPEQWRHGWRSSTGGGTAPAGSSGGGAGVSGRDALVQQALGQDMGMGQQVGGGVVACGGAWCGATDVIPLSEEWAAGVLGHGAAGVCCVRVWGGVGVHAYGGEE